MTVLIRAMDLAYLLVASFHTPHPDQLTQFATRDQCVTARKTAYTNEKNNHSINHREFRCEKATLYYSTHPDRAPVPRETPKPPVFTNPRHLIKV